MFSAIFDWLTLSDYEREQRDIVRKVVARYARGNVNLQNGRYIDQAALDELRQRGDRASTSLLAQRDRSVETVHGIIERLR